MVLLGSKNVWIGSIQTSNWLMDFPLGLGHGQFKILSKLKIEN